MPTTKITIDASALKSVDFNQFIRDYFAAVTAAGESTYYDGTVVNSMYGPQWVRGDQVGFRYTTDPENDNQVLMEGSDIAYNFLTYGTNHGISGRVNSLTFGSYDNNTTFTETAAARGELTGVIPGLLISNLRLVSGKNDGNDYSNAVYELYSALRNGNLETNVDLIYDILSRRAQNFIGSDGDDSYLGTDFGDTIHGGRGGDVLKGEGGKDKIFGEDGDDDISGGAGDDILRGGNGEDKISAGTGDDVIVGGGAADLLRGGGGNDELSGGAGGDIVLGDRGNDTLFGNAGADHLRGGNGNDKLYGGVGADKLVGGAGEDMFIFVSQNESSTRAIGRDTIFDFNAEQGDRVDLSGIDANLRSNGDQAFSFIGEADFSGKAGELRFTKMKSDTLVLADLDGDGKADFSLHFDDALSLQRGDFIL